MTTHLRAWHRHLNMMWRGKKPYKGAKSTILAHIHDRSLAWLGKGTSIKGGGGKTTEKNKINTSTWQLTFLAWHRHFNKRRRDEKLLKDGKSITLTHTHNRSLFWLGKGTLIKSGGYKNHYINWISILLILSLPNENYSSTNCRY